MNAVRAQGHGSASATQLVRDFPAVRRMTEHGPVHITAHGRTEAVLISHADFELLATGTGLEDRQAEWKLSLTLESIESQVLIVDDDMVISGVNRAICQVFGMSAEEMVGKRVAELATNPTDLFIVRRMQEVLISGVPEVLVIPSVRRPDRTTRYNLKPWPGGAALFADDVTEREKMRDKAIADQATDCSLEALGGIGQAHVQSNGTIISSGAGLSKMVGSSANLLAGARLQSLFDPMSRSVVDKALIEKSTEARTYRVNFLRNGVSAVPAVLSVATYWTAEHHACASIILFAQDFENRKSVSDVA